MMIEPKNYVLEYIENIKSGKIIVSKRIKRVYLGWMEPILNDLNPKYFFNPNSGLKVIKFIETYCKQSKAPWAGKPLKLMLWQKAFIQVLYGTLRRVTKKRRFTEVFLVVARKNGKTTITSPIAMWEALKEDGAEVYAAATVTSQAARILQEAINMIDQDRNLSGVFSYRKSPPLTLQVKGSPSYVRALSSEVKTQDGLNVSTAIIDEVHELDRNVYDILKQATSARELALIIMITTGGFVRGGLFDDLYDHAVNVLDDISPDETMLPLLYELDNKDEVMDKKMWVKANPSLGVVKQESYLEEMIIKMESDKNLRNTVLTKDFNIRGVENKAWLLFDDLNNEIIYSEEELKQFDNSFALGGMDLSRTGDFSSYTTTLFDKKNHRVVAITMYWITAKFYNDQLSKPNNRIPWRAWVDRGLVRISGTETIDYRDIASYVVNNFKEKGWMYQYIHYDSYSAVYLLTELEAHGYRRDSCLIATHQGAKTLSIPMQLMEAHLKEKILCYQNNPVTKWCLTNLQLEQDRNGNYMPKKINDQRERKIDGAATILNCYVGIAKSITYYLGERRGE